MDSSQCYNIGLKFALAYEGGYVNDPADAGGATMKGVTQATYNTYRKGKGLAIQNVQKLSNQELADIYKKMYWDAGGCGNLPYPLCVAMFDTCVNFGILGAAKKLQEAVGTTVDGKIGPKTLALATDPTKAILHAVKLCDARIAHRYRRVEQNGSQARFLKGWLNRDNALKALVRK